MPTVYDIGLMLRNKRNWRGECYEAAAEYILACHRAMIEDALLVQGAPVYKGSNPQYRSKRIGHAWIEHNGECYDITTPDFFSPYFKEHYYMVGQLDEPFIKRYTFHEARRWMLDTQHYGPWEICDVS